MLLNSTHLQLRLGVSGLLLVTLSASSLSGCGLLPRPPGLARLPKGTLATKAKLKQVQPGMAVAEVVAIFGSTGHVSKGSSPTNPPFMSWTNEDMTGAIIMFDKGRVTRRMQVGALN